jgi:hypothetical protein
MELELDRKLLPDLLIIPSIPHGALVGVLVHSNPGFKFSICHAWKNKINDANDFKRTRRDLNSSCSWNSEPLLAYCGRASINEPRKYEVKITDLLRMSGSGKLLPQALTMFEVSSLET